MIEIREFDFGKECPAFMGLYYTVYKKAVNEAYCQWKFIDNPFGQAFGFGAWDGDNLVGFVALTPYQFIIEGQVHTASQGADTMVHPNYRGKGLFVDLTSELLDEMNKKGWWLRYSAPGKMSCPGYIKKLEHKTITILPYWVKIRPMSYVRYNLGQRVNINTKKVDIYKKGGLDIKIVKVFSPEYGNLWEKMKSNHILSIVKNSLYLNWRYANHPLFNNTILECKENGELAGYAVLHGGNLLDLCSGGRGNVCEGLLKVAETIWRGTNCVMSHAWILGEPSLDRGLKTNGWVKYGLKPRPFGIYPEQPIICYVNPGIEKATVALNPDKWRFCMGDVDCM